MWPNATDNLGLKNISVQLEGAVEDIGDTTFTTAVTSASFIIDLVFPTNTVAGGYLYITAQAIDGNNNGATALDSIWIVNEDALTVTLLDPQDGAVTSAGKQIPVTVRATQRDGVKRVGYTYTGVISGGDSTGDLLLLPADTTFYDTLTIPTGAPDGAFTVRGFATDSALRRQQSTPATVTIQSAANDNEPPQVTFYIGFRVEVDDSITVNATDPSGIALIGWEARDLLGLQIGGDSTTLAGNLTDVTHMWTLGFNFTSLPVPVVVTAFAADAVGNRGTATTSSAPPAVTRQRPSLLRILVPGTVPGDGANAARGAR
jgi:hypothetical protein